MTPMRRHRPLRGKESATPGVSKIKSALRQTRRLLAKEKLAADVRVESERRLKALEAELAQAEHANKERALATRYHKVKFFERQKVTRKITQTERRLSSETSDVSKKKLEATLHELRIDLNYILHYPKSQKYISLFPPEVRQGDTSSTPATEEAAKTAQTREEIRSWVRLCMERGELLMVPDIHQPPELKSKTKQKDWRGVMDVKKPDKTKAKSKIVLQEERDAIEQDDFFGEDDEDS